MKKRLFLFLIFSFIFFIFLAYFYQPNQNDVLNYQDLLKLNDNDFIFIDVGSKKIRAEVARSPLKREKGLSQRQNLEDNEGMIFIFEQEGNWSFWMKQMLFNLDIIFLKDNKVVDIAENMPYPLSENNIAVVSPKQKANLVLEVNAGLVKKCNIKIGDKVIFLK
jgi:uncharacterized membrane protein (UPF0127 family)